MPNRKCCHLHACHCQSQCGVRKVKISPLESTQAEKFNMQPCSKHMLRYLTLLLVINHTCCCCNQKSLMDYLSNLLTFYSSTCFTPPSLLHIFVSILFWIEIIIIESATSEPFPFISRIRWYSLVALVWQLTLFSTYLVVRSPYRFRALHLVEHICSILWCISWKYLNRAWFCI
jgi:hypothetical protein